MSPKKTIISESYIYQCLEKVKDPEIPVISIKSLGILQNVKVTDDAVLVEIIPTYSGCPAMYAIQEDIKSALLECGIAQVEVKLVSQPIWNTDMISEDGRKAMRDYGIAPPVKNNEKVVVCPQCGSSQTSCISQFGSTACKALYRCESCLEPFDYFKCHA